MNGNEKTVTSAEALLEASREPGTERVLVSGLVNGASSIRLSRGQSLCGVDGGAEIAFRAGADGIQLSADNTVRNLRLYASTEKRAVFNDTTVATLGRIELRDVTTTGRVQILARDKVRAGHVEVDGLDIVTADARRETERPHSYSVYVQQGAFTLWNMQSSEDVIISADLVDISAGRNGAPARGSGIFVSGAGETGGRLLVHRLETGAVYCNGGIEPGTSDCISGGVFVVHGAAADLVRSRGPVTTYGANDMVLDNWGMVDRWVAEEKITSHGPSGIGFVNFGTINSLQVNAPIETFGQGARGFNVYSGSVNSAEFERIVTHADGAVGIQISQPVGQIKVSRGIETFGGTGKSLVKGVVVELSAIALSVKSGGSARQIHISGGAITHGNGVAPLELHGAIEALQVTESLAAAGGGFEVM